jgi:Tol biopolymer transport system component
MTRALSHGSGKALAVWTILALVVIAGCGGSSPVTGDPAGSVGDPGSSDARRGQILFVRSGREPGVDWEAELWVMDPDGGARQLTRNGSADYDPAFSPDGTQLAFVRLIHDGPNPGYAPEWTEIHVMRPDGTGERALTTHRANDFSPTWSPDGTKLAFVSERDGNREIYVMNADGSDPLNLTNHDGDDEEPSWSPDGRQLVFTAYRTGRITPRGIERDGDIWVVNADGSGQRKVVGTHDAQERLPRWTPDGTKIAFRSMRDFNIQPHGSHRDNPQLLLVNPDGSDPRVLTGGGWDYDVLPDGSALVAVSGFGGLAFVPLDPPGPAEVRFPEGQRPVVSPDGRRVVFVRWHMIPSPPDQAPLHGLQGELWVANIDGSGLRRLTDNAASDLPAGWR